MKYTIKDFLAGKVDVRCETDKQKKALLKICKDNGILWYGDTEIDNIFPRSPVLEIGYFCIGRLTQSNGHNHRTVVDFSEIALSDAPRYQIVIESDGNTTTAKMVVNGREVKQATTKRNPADKANWRMGAQTAFDRLWQKQPKPEKPVDKANFKVGDRVVCVCSPLNNNVLGEHGRIVAFSCFGDVGVEFDKNVNGHALDGLGVTAATKNGHCWWCSPNYLRHEQPTKQKVREVKRHAKVGEYVRIAKKFGSVRCNYENGEVHKVIEEVTSEMVRLSCGGVGAFDEEYVVLEGYQPGRDA